MKHTFKLVALAALLIVISVNAAQAVMVIPPRLVIKDNVKTEHIFIKNNAKKTEAFRFSWKHIAMDKQGKVLNLDKLGMDKAPAGYKSLDKIIRFSPRRAVLKPGETQRITFMMRRSSSLPAGEYRSHFLVEREPAAIANVAPANDTVNAGEEPNAQAAEKSPAVAIGVLVSRAVPIYVLNGETDATLTLLKAEIKDNTKRVNAKQPAKVAHFRVQKVGNRSIIGIARIFCTSGGEEVVISKSSKVFAVYAEGEFRDEAVGVQIPPKGCSSYRIAIKAHPDDVHAGKLLADSTFK